MTMLCILISRILQSLKVENLKALTNVCHISMQIAYHQVHTFNLSYCAHIREDASTQSLNTPMTDTEDDHHYPDMYHKILEHSMCPILELLNNAKIFHKWWSGSNTKLTQPHRGSAEGHETSTIPLLTQVLQISPLLQEQPPNIQGYSGLLLAELALPSFCLLCLICQECQL